MRIQKTSGDFTLREETSEDFRRLSAIFRLHETSNMKSPLLPPSIAVEK
jgi:hypothetical protein